MRREVERMLKELRRQGWTCERRASGHWRLRSPDGQLYFSASTPSDHRSLKNMRAGLRRMGAVL